MAKEAAQNLQEPAQQAVQEVKSAGTEAVETVKAEGTSTAADVTGSAKEGAQNVKQTSRTADAVAERADTDGAHRADRRGAFCCGSCVCGRRSVRCRRRPDAASRVATRRLPGGHPGWGQSPAAAPIASAGVVAAQQPPDARVAPTPVRREARLACEDGARPTAYAARSDGHTVIADAVGQGEIAGTRRTPAPGPPHGRTVADGLGPGHPQGARRPAAGDHRRGGAHPRRGADRRDHGPPARAGWPSAGCSRRRASGSRRWRATPPPGGPTSRATRRWPTRGRDIPVARGPRSETGQQEDRRAGAPAPSRVSPTAEGGVVRDHGATGSTAPYPPRTAARGRTPPCPSPRCPIEVEAMLARPNHAVIASSRPDGQPVSVATWYLYEKRPDPGQHGRGPAPAGLPARRTPGSA